MRSVWKSTAGLAAVLIAGGGAPSVSRANPELPATYDSRSVGMGGTGTAFLEGATGGTYFNPALLDGVEKLDVALSISPFVPLLNTPLAQPGTVSPTEQTSTEPTVIPLGLLAVGVRVHERVTVGLGAYVASGIGGRYENVRLLDAAATPLARRGEFDDMNLEVAVFEATLPVSVRITKDLSIGAAWRTGYTTQATTVLIPNEAGPGLVSRVDQELSGYSLLGGTFGIRYRVSKMVSLGLSYRTKMTMDLDGKTDIEGNAGPPGAPTSVVSQGDTKSEWSTPHQVRLGSSFSLLEDRLLLALEGRVQLYREANKQQSSVIDLTGQPLMAITMAPELESTNKLSWQNAYTMQLGAEYWVLPMLALRLGATVGNSATNAKYVSAFTPPPGVMYSFTAGVGCKWTHWHAGLAGSVLHAGRDVEASDIANGPTGAPSAPAGNYSGNLILVALSAGYRM